MLAQSELDSPPSGDGDWANQAATEAIATVSVVPPQRRVAPTKETDRCIVLPPGRAVVNDSRAPLPHQPRGDRLFQSCLAHRRATASTRSILRRSGEVGAP